MLITSAQRFKLIAKKTLEGVDYTNKSYSVPSRAEINSKRETWAILRSYGYSSLINDPDMIWL